MKVLLAVSIVILSVIGSISLTTSIEINDLLILGSKKKVEVRGCCSSHGGVDCEKGSTRNGKVICADGWKRSKCSYKKHCG
ncbi:MAG: hypothetical protein IEMM0008_0117 [bacterium]|nr:MAG: hypothetical protein IEMM0008_0117 [bacterium]